MNLENARNKLSSENSIEVISSLLLLKVYGELTDLPAILGLIKRKNREIQKAAVKTSCTIIREKLITSFNELEPNVRKKLGTLLESLHPSIINEISSDLYSKDKERRLRSVQVLGLLKKNPQISKILGQLAADKDEKIRATAVILLGKFAEPNDHEIILSVLRDKDKRVRANTIEAIESLGNPRLLPILQRFRKDANNRIRGNVLKALYKLGKVDIESDLMDMLESGNDFMRASALWVIRETLFATPDLTDATAHCLILENDMVHDNAQKTLTALNTVRANSYMHYLADI